MGELAHFRRENHYVPRLALKHWQGDEGVWVYRLLVSHDNVSLWKPTSAKSLAKHVHLYTRLVAGVASDEVERWLEREFETPAEEPIQKVLAGSRLTRSDWQSLIRFAACQRVRTPARLVEDIQRWSSTLQPVIDGTLKKAVERLETAQRDGIELETEADPLSGYIPLRVTTEIQPGEEFGQLKAELVMGRGLWLFGIRHSLTHTIKVLLQHKWTILSPPDGTEWITSDDPVILLNYYGSGNYDFKGGWGSPGTEIILPLGPRHLLYTMVGHRSKYRQIVSPEIAAMMRRFIVEHAHRYVFAANADTEVPQLRQRVVNDAAFRDEATQWQKWHTEQSRAERELMGWDGPDEQLEPG